MEKRNVGYREAQDTLVNRLRLIVKNLGEELFEESNNPLSSKSFSIVVQPSTIWGYRNDYTNVRLWIFTDELFPRVSRSINNFDIVNGDINLIEKKLRVIIAENNRIIATKKNETAIRNSRAEALMKEFKAFKPKKQDWGIIITFGPLIFDIPASERQIDVKFNGNHEDLIDIVKKLSSN